jgi:hypothetical protein
LQLGVALLKGASRLVGRLIQLRPEAQAIEARRAPRIWTMAPSFRLLTGVGLGPEGGAALRRFAASYQIEAVKVNAPTVATTQRR